MKTNTPRKIEKLDLGKTLTYHDEIIAKSNEHTDAINYILDWIRKQEEDNASWLPENTGKEDTSEVEDEDDL